MKYRPYLVPLQAFIALFLCAGMAWMVVVMAGFNPNPPTAMDIKMRSTAEVSLVSLNSTAAALAVQMVSDFMPTAIVLPPTVALEITEVPTSTLSYVLIPVYGPSQTPSPTPFSFRSLLFPPTKAHDPDPTRTQIPTPTLVPTSTNTLRPTVTVPTSTPVPTHTATLVPPTATTAPPPTDTNTSEPPPTNPPPTDTSEPPPTNTNEPPPPTNEPPATDTPNAAP